MTGKEDISRDNREREKWDSNIEKLGDVEDQIFERLLSCRESREMRRRLEMVQTNN